MKPVFNGPPLPEEDCLPQMLHEPVDGCTGNRDRRQAPGLCPGVDVCLENSHVFPSHKEAQLEPKWLRV